MKTRKIKYAGGFTLVEALFAAMLIGLVVAAIAVSSGAATMVNGAGIDISTAEFLIEEIREQSATVTFENLPDLNGQTYNPPIDITGVEIAEFSTFSQVVTVEYVLATDLSQTSMTPTDFVRVTVTINKNSAPISSASWIRANVN